MTMTTDYLRECAMTFLECEMQDIDRHSRPIRDGDVGSTLRKADNAKSYEEAVEFWDAYLRECPIMSGPDHRLPETCRHSSLFMKASGLGSRESLFHVIELLLLAEEDWAEGVFPDTLSRSRSLGKCLSSLCKHLFVLCRDQGDEKVAAMLSALLKRPEGSCVREHPTLGLVRSKPELLGTDWAKTHWTFLKQATAGPNPECVAEFVPTLLACHCLASSAGNAWEGAAAENADDESTKLIIGYLVREADRFRWLCIFLQDAGQVSACEASCVDPSHPASLTTVGDIRLQLKLAEERIRDLWHSSRMPEEQVEQEGLGTLLRCSGLLAELNILTEEKLRELINDALRNTDCEKRQKEWQKSLQETWKQGGKNWGLWRR